MLQNEVIKYLITQIFSKNRDIKLPKYSIHKVLFKLKQELPEDNPIRNCLPFYWYNYGPFSEAIEYNIDDLKQYGQLKEYTISEERAILGLNEDIAVPNVDGLEDAKEKLNSIVTRVDFYNFKLFVDEIYRVHAPCAFMPLFKLDFMDTLQDYVERESFGQKTLFAFSDSYPEVDKLEDLIYGCEAELPSVPHFNSFNNFFSSFVTNAGRVFDHIRDGNKNSVYLGETVLHISKVIWFTFAKGIRILDNGHDEYYKGRLKNWDHLYNQSLSEFYFHIDNFNSSTLKYVEPSISHTENLTEKSKKILSSVVDGYIL